MERQRSPREPQKKKRIRDDGPSSSSSSSIRSSTSTSTPPPDGRRMTTTKPKNRNGGGIFFGATRTGRFAMLYGLVLTAAFASTRTVFTAFWIATRSSGSASFHQQTTASGASRTSRQQRRQEEDVVVGGPVKLTEFRGDKIRGEISEDEADDDDGTVIYVAASSDNDNELNYVTQDELEQINAKRIADDEIDRSMRLYALERERGDGSGMGPIEYNEPNMTMFGLRHPALVPLDDKYKPQKEWRYTTIADVNIVGQGKAGTSQLYKILSNHPQFRQFHKRKELCVTNFKDPEPFRIWENVPLRANARKPTKKQVFVQKELFEFHRRTHGYTMKEIQRERQAAGLDADGKGDGEENRSFRRLKTVNGCIQMFEIMMSYRYVKPSRGKKRYVFIFRDPADWIWAFWNFWKQPSTDSVITWEGQWANKTDTYRSPEFFHEIVASGTKTLLGKALLKRRREFVYSGRALIDMVGKENVLFLRNEDLLPSRVAEEGGLLSKLADFARVDIKGFVPETYMHMTNCNDVKGEYNKCNRTNTAYEIAGGREMLPKTRRLLYYYFWSDCKIWEKEFDVVYPDCVNVINNENDNSDDYDNSDDVESS